MVWSRPSPTLFGQSAVPVCSSSRSRPTTVAKRRNDLLVGGSDGLEISMKEHDVKVYPILGDKIYKSVGQMGVGRVTEAPPADAKS